MRAMYYSLPVLAVLNFGVALMKPHGWMDLLSIGVGSFCLYTFFRVRRSM